MGGVAIKDQVASVSPWNTQVVIDNQCTTPLHVFLARDSSEPSVKNSIDHTVPPLKSYTIHSGWLNEPTATLIMRTAIHEAKVFRMPHMARLTVELAPSGFKVATNDQVDIEEYEDPGTVPNTDTAAMLLRRESFMDLRPSLERSISLARQRSSPSLPGPLKDQVSSVSPWRTQIVIDNQCTTPVRVYLARDSEAPTVDNSIDHSVPAQSSYSIHSGWLSEHLATLIMRTGIHEAKVFRMPHMAQLKVVLAPSGLKVTSSDEYEMIVEDYPDPGSVPNNDTVPMVLREESFMDRKPGSQEPGASRTWRPGMSPSHSANSPSCHDRSTNSPSRSPSRPRLSPSSPAGSPHFRGTPEPMLHGRPVEGGLGMYMHS